VADPGSLLRRRREARTEVAGLRFLAAVQLVGALVFGLQAWGRWIDADGRGWERWVLSASALGLLGFAFGTWRRWRRERARLSALVGIDLAPVTETRLALLVAAALEGAAPDEVTPPITQGERWTPERVEWLRGFHRDRRRGLDGPAGEVTWAVVEIADGEGRDVERVVGGVRLRRTGEPGTFETGMWLVRDARSRGVGRSAMRLLLARAGEAGAARVRAETTIGNAGAVSLLRSLGFDTDVDGEHVRAELSLS
jgi:RimJ/RimL family protein N-acetyltransferase